MASSPTLLAGQDMTADLMGVPAWIAMSPLLNSWANLGAGTSAAQYRLWKILNSVEVVGVILGGASGTTFFTLPGGFIPATINGFAAGTNSGSAWGNQTYIQCDTSGNLSVQSLPTGSPHVVFHGWISLDA